MVCGAWFAVGPLAWPVISNGGSDFVASTHLRVLVYEVGYRIGTGLILVICGAFVDGWASRHPQKATAVTVPSRGRLRVWTDRVWHLTENDDAITNARERARSPRERGSRVTQALHHAGPGAGLLGRGASCVRAPCQVGVSPPGHQRGCVGRCREGLLHRSEPASDHRTVRGKLPRPPSVHRSRRKDVPRGCRGSICGLVRTSRAICKT
jgi:hypothetical protein